MFMLPDDLKDYRAFYGLSQRAIAKVLGVSQTYIVMLESGECKIPDYVPLRLGVTTEQMQNIRMVKAERLALYPQYHNKKD